jgi:hypothetical protein
VADDPGSRTAGASQGTVPATFAAARTASTSPITALERHPVRTTRRGDHQRAAGQFSELHPLAARQRVVLANGQRLRNRQERAVRQTVHPRGRSGHAHVSSALSHRFERGLCVSDGQPHRLAVAPQGVGEHVARDGLARAQHHRARIRPSAQLGQKSRGLLLEIAGEGPHPRAVGCQLQRAALSGVQLHPELTSELLHLDVERGLGQVQALGRPRERELVCEDSEGLESVVANHCYRL